MNTSVKDKDTNTYMRLVMVTICAFFALVPASYILALPALVSGNISVTRFAAVYRMFGELADMLCICVPIRFIFIFREIFIPFKTGLTPKSNYVSHKGSSSDTYNTKIAAHGCLTNKRTALLMAAALIALAAGVVFPQLCILSVIVIGCLFATDIAFTVYQYRGDEYLIWLALLALRVLSQGLFGVYL